MSNLRKLRRARSRREEATPRWVPWVAGLGAIIAVLLALGVALDAGPGTPTGRTAEATVVQPLRPRGTRTAPTSVLVRLPDGREIPVVATAPGTGTLPAPGDRVVLEVRESRLLHRRQYRFLRRVEPRDLPPKEAPPPGTPPATGTP